MRIFKRLKTGKLKGWTIRLSKNGWYDLYSDGGVSQTTGKHSIDEIAKIINEKEKQYRC